MARAIWSGAISFGLGFFYFRTEGERIGALVAEHGPANEEANWRVPTVLFAGFLGMAAGGWGAGALYDSFGFYLPAFAVGMAFNLLNLIVLLCLVVRQCTWMRVCRQSGRGSAAVR